MPHHTLSLTPHHTPRTSGSNNLGPGKFRKLKEAAHNRCKDERTVLERQAGAKKQLVLEHGSTISSSKKALSRYRAF